MVTQFVPRLRQLQQKLMTERVDVYRGVTEVGHQLPCRIHTSRLFAEPGDPSDANMRSMTEWGFTLPWDVNVRIGDQLMVGTRIDAIAGEVLFDDTWITAVRVWATRPKIATARTPITFWRGNYDDDAMTQIGPFIVQVVYDRNKAIEPPIRYVPAGRAQYKTGWFVGGMELAVLLPEDRFLFEGYAGIVIEVLPGQPQHIEVRFLLDEGGAR
jgi:hypothetical protein